VSRAARAGRRPLSRVVCGDDRGAGTVAALGLGLGMVAVLLLVLPLYGALATRHSVAAAADAAALAAADTASGLVPGYPCETAERVAAANGASLVECTIDGPVATVTVARGIPGAPFRLQESATAGPAGSTAD
jgi:secretion/DNA translocation related TadE-like protein